MNELKKLFSLMGLLFLMQWLWVPQSYSSSKNQQANFSCDFSAEDLLQYSLDSLFKDDAEQEEEEEEEEDSQEEESKKRKARQKKEKSPRFKASCKWISV